MTRYDIWREGYETNGMRDGAALLGSEEGTSFADACARLAARDCDFGKYFSADRMTFWGCRLFGNEADARKAFG